MDAETETPAPAADPWQSGEHALFRAFLCGVRARDLPPLRHLLACPLCRQLARVVLFGFLPAAGDPARETPSHRPRAGRP